MSTTTTFRPYSPPPESAEKAFRAATGRVGAVDAGAPVALLGRCKTCKRGVRIPDAVPGSWGRMVGPDKFTPADRAIAPWWDGRDAYQIGDVVGLAFCGNRWEGMVIHCPNCGPEVRAADGGVPRVRLHPVRGTFAPDHKCDGRCMSATGPSCECACGGRNHGANHG